MYTNETLTRPKHFAQIRGRDRETKTPFFPDYSAEEEELLRASKPIESDKSDATRNGTRHP